MPTYQYACTACEHRFEAVQKFTDASLTECPECEGKLRKLYSSVGVVFKGSGFYRTDSRSGSKGASSSSESSSGSSTSSSSESSTSSTTSSSSSSDSKPAAAKSGTSSTTAKAS